MLDFVYYPVSALLWAGHTAAATVLGTSLAWIAAVALLVIAVRAAHVTARMTLRRGAGQRTLPLLRPLTLWVLPGTALAGAALLPVVVLVYLATNALCTVDLQVPRVPRATLDRWVREREPSGSPCTTHRAG